MSNRRNTASQITANRVNLSDFESSSSIIRVNNLRDKSPYAQMRKSPKFVTPKYKRVGVPNGIDGQFSRQSTVCETTEKK
jgi:hypothetical protein